LRFRICRKYNFHNTIEKQLYGFLTVFGLLALGMYFKGLVRVQLIQLFLSIIPSSLLLAILIQHRSALPRAVRVSVACIGSLFVCSAIWSACLEAQNLRSQQSVAHLAKRMLLSKSSPEIWVRWCKTVNPLT